MLKRILSVLLALSFLIVLPALSGCEKDESTYSTEKRTKMENIPAGESKIIQKGDN